MIPEETTYVLGLEIRTICTSNAINFPVRVWFRFKKLWEVLIRTICTSNAISFSVRVWFRFKKIVGGFNKQKTVVMGGICPSSPIKMRVGGSIQLMTSRLHPHSDPCTGSKVADQGARTVKNQQPPSRMSQQPSPLMCPLLRSPVIHSCR